MDENDKDDAVPVWADGAPDGHVPGVPAYTATSYADMLAAAPRRWPARELRVVPLAHSVDDAEHVFGFLTR